MAFLWKKGTWYLILTDDLDTKEKVVPQGIHILNIKAVSLTIQKLWPMKKFFVDKQADKQTVRKTDMAKTICPQFNDAGT